MKDEEIDRSLEAFYEEFYETLSNFHTSYGNGLFSGVSAEFKETNEAKVKASLVIFQKVLIGAMNDAFVDFEEATKPILKEQLRARLLETQETLRDKCQRQALAQRLSEANRMIELSDMLFKKFPEGKPSLQAPLADVTNNS